MAKKSNRNTKAKKGSVSKPVITVGGKLWLENGGEKFLGPGPVELLELIRDTGSISKAAKQMGMSYKKASALVQALNAIHSTPLISTQSGGDHGGGSSISEFAEKLIEYHRQLRKRFEAFLAKESADFPF